MQKCFFLICPTDCLESTINKIFKYENYFYTSLGNSFNYENKTLESIKKIIRKHKIKEIYFVISIDNKIILDAFGYQFFSEIRGLKKLYNEIISQKEESKISLQRGNDKFLVLSYYLNKRIRIAIK